MTRPGIIAGALVGGLLTAPLIAIFSLAGEIAGLPIFTFDLFPLVVSVLPNALVNFGKEFIVDIILALQLGSIDDTAKLGEHGLMIVMVLSAGILIGAAFFAFMNTSNDSRRFAPGLALGFAVGIPILIVSTTSGDSATVDPVIGAIWILMAFFAWGGSLSRIYDDLRQIQPPAEAAESASETGDPAVSLGAWSNASLAYIDRRQFLVRIGSASAAITVIGAGVNLLASSGRSQSALTTSLAEQGLRLWSADNALPNAGAALAPAPGTRPELTPIAEHYRIDINLGPPRIDAESWRLRINGLVDNPMEFALDDLRDNYEPMSQFITMACISNPIGGDLIGTQRWTGVSLQKILEEVQPQDSGTHLRVTSVDGFDEILARSQIEQDERLMLTYAWDGIPLTTRNGFPLRIYIPNVYGMKQPKWITDIEFVEGWEAGYWVRRGWDPVARMLATSVIDTVATDDVYEQDGQMFVPIGGIASAGTRGISKVEVRVDNGDWREAELRAPISEATWTLWRYDWPFEAGQHSFAVRTTEGNGTPQIETVRNVAPAGATGLHGVRVNL